MRSFATALTALVTVTAAQAQTSSHPLDGLSPSEYWAAYEVLQASGKLDSTAKLLCGSSNWLPSAPPYRITARRCPPIGTTWETC